MRKSNKKKSLRGFTLIEVLVAMMILGICSLVFVGMYASVCKHLKNNNQINDRMSEQQKYIETKNQKSSAGTDVFQIMADPKIAGVGGNTAYSSADTSKTIRFELKCTYNQADSSWTNNKNFYTNCAVYSLKNIEDGEPIEDANDTDDMKVDYKYFVGDNTMKP